MPPKGKKKKDPGAASGADPAAGQKAAAAKEEEQKRVADYFRLSMNLQAERDKLKRLQAQQVSLEQSLLRYQHSNLDAKMKELAIAEQQDTAARRSLEECVEKTKLAGSLISADIRRKFDESQLEKKALDNLEKRKWEQEAPLRQVQDQGETYAGVANTLEEKTKKMTDLKNKIVQLSLYLSFTSRYARYMREQGNTMKGIQPVIKPVRASQSLPPPETRQKLSKHIMSSSSMDNESEVSVREFSEERDLDPITELHDDREEADPIVSTKLRVGASSTSLVSSTSGSSSTSSSSSQAMRRESKALLPNRAMGSSVIAHSDVVATTTNGAHIDAELAASVDSAGGINANHSINEPSSDSGTGGMERQNSGAVSGVRVLDDVDTKIKQIEKTVDKLNGPPPLAVILLELAQMNSFESELIEDVLLSLDGALSVDAENAAILGAIGGLELIVKLLNLHKGREHLAIAGCRVLWKLFYSTSNIEQFVKLEGITLLAMELDTFIRCTGFVPLILDLFQIVVPVDYQDSVSSGNENEKLLPFIGHRLTDNHVRTSLVDIRPLLQPLPSAIDKTPSLLEKDDEDRRKTSLQTELQEQFTRAAQQRSRSQDPNKPSASSLHTTDGEFREKSGQGAKSSKPFAPPLLGFGKSSQRMLRGSALNLFREEVIEKVSSSANDREEKDLATEEGSRQHTRAKKEQPLSIQHAAAKALASDAADEAASALREAETILAMTDGPDLHALERCSDLLFAAILLCCLRPPAGLKSKEEKKESLQGDSSSSSSSRLKRGDSVAEEDEENGENAGKERVQSDTKGQDIEGINKAPALLPSASSGRDLTESPLSSHTLAVSIVSSAVAQATDEAVDLSMSLHLRNQRDEDGDAESSAKKSGSEASLSRHTSQKTTDQKQSQELCRKEGPNLGKDIRPATRRLYNRPTSALITAESFPYQHMSHSGTVQFLIRACNVIYWLLIHYPIHVQWIHSLKCYRILLLTSLIYLEHMDVQQALWKAISLAIAQSDRSRQHFQLVSAEHILRLIWNKYQSNSEFSQELQPLLQYFALYNDKLKSKSRSSGSAASPAAGSTSPSTPSQHTATSPSKRHISGLGTGDHANASGMRKSSLALSTAGSDSSGVGSVSPTRRGSSLSPLKKFGPR